MTCAVEVGGLRWHDIHTKFRDDSFRHLNSIVVNT
jgi:hypothetical protein